MPKGVEHLLSKDAQGRRSRMRNSVMPKGVEHAGPLAGPPGSQAMRNSVMPKGVEHAAITAMDRHVTCGIQ